MHITPFDNIQIWFANMNVIYNFCDLSQISNIFFIIYVFRTS